jgi:hypothetical protein
VVKAIKAGRLPRALRVIDGRRFVDAEIGVVEWSSSRLRDRTDAPDPRPMPSELVEAPVPDYRPSSATRQVGGHVEAETAPPQVGGEVDELAATRTDQAAEELETPREASARLKLAQARLAELRYAAEIRELLPAREVVAGWSAVLGQIRSAVEAVPGRLRELCPETPEGSLVRVRELLREALESAADWRPEA